MKKMIKEKYNIFAMTPLKIVLIYFFTGITWIFISDNLLAIKIPDPESVKILQHVKGVSYVLMTSIVLFLLIKSNIRELIKVNIALKESEERYRLAIEGSKDSPWYWVPSTGEFFSLTLNEILNVSSDESPKTLQDLEALVHPDDFSNFKNAMTLYLNKEVSQYTAEYRLKSKSGEYKWIFSRAKASWDCDDNPVRLDGVHSDITISKNIEEELKRTSDENKKLYDEIIKYDKLKTEFFSNISHELKTPLTVIFSMVQLIDFQYKDGKIIDKSNGFQKRISVMKQNCYRLLRLINNLIDITKIDSGYLKPNFHNHNIVSVVEEITLSVAQYSEETKTITLEFDTDVEEKIIACDVDKIERIMLNLLSNAVKFTPQGGHIWVKVFDKGDKVIISVRDSGIGIPENMHNIIFERFRQVDSSLTRSKEGSGIGLSLVKSLAEIHGGKVTVNSILGGGSEFIVELPVRVLENDTSLCDSGSHHNFVERINIEFSDIYSNNAM